MGIGQYFQNTGPSTKKNLHITMMIRWFKRATRCTGKVVSVYYRDSEVVYRPRYRIH